MRFRKLRIAWSVFWGLAAVLLIVLWVRSYWSRPWAYVRMFDNYVECSTCRGRFGLQVLGEHFGPAERATKWNVGSMAIDTKYPMFPTTAEKGFMMSLGTLRTSGNITLNNWRIVAPSWFVSSLCIALATVPWLRWSNRFGLRTLLIATTLVAVALGLIVYATQQ
jgi:hypothetical protein